MKRIPIENIVEEFTLAANKDDDTAAWNVINRALADGLSPVEVYEYILSPSLAALHLQTPAGNNRRTVETLEKILDKLHPRLMPTSERRPQVMLCMPAAEPAGSPLLKIRARVLTDLLANDGWRVTPITDEIRNATPRPAPEALIFLASPGIGENEIRETVSTVVKDPRQVRTIIVSGTEQQPPQDLNALTVPDEYQARTALKEEFASKLTDTRRLAEASLLPGQLSLSFESSDILMCILDEQQRILSANRIARDDFGLCAGEPVMQYLDAGSREIFEALMRGNNGIATQLVEVGFFRHGREYLAEILLLPCGENRVMLAYPKQEEVERMTNILNNYNREINKLNNELRELRGLMRQQSGALDAANAQIGTAYEELNASQMEDPLTGAFNKRYYTVNLINEINRSRRYQRSLGFLLIDVDDFSKINEGYGYPAGDETLRHIVKIISRHTRHGIDWIARVGDEEFVVVLPETDMEGCLRVGEKLRNLVATSPVEFNKHHILATISVGGAAYDALQDVPLSFQELTTRADEALDEARKHGPNNQRIEPIE